MVADKTHLVPLDEYPPIQDALAAIGRPRFRVAPLRVTG